MMATRGVSGPALGALAVGGLVIYAGITDQPVTTALRNLVKGKAAKPAAFAKPSGDSSGSSGVKVGAGPFAALAEAASKYLGVKYRWGGSDPATGLDCSGLVYRSFLDLGINAPRVSSAQLLWDQVTRIPRSQVAAGDLVGHLGLPGHIGIAISADEGIFAPHTGTVVQVQRIDSVILRSIGIYARYIPRSLAQTVSGRGIR